jgi:hypothetical protein
MIKIENYSGQLGNHMLHFYNMVQIANKINIEYNSIDWDGNKMFLLKNGTKFLPKKIRFNSRDILNLGIENFINIINNVKDNTDIILDYPALGELFYKFDNISTFDIFKIKDDLKQNLDNNYVHVSLHLLSSKKLFEWDPVSVLPLKYYTDSIDFIKDEYSSKKIKFHVFVNDDTYDVYHKVIKYLKDDEIILGNVNDYIKDFLVISECDIIVMPPSTYSISASFCGKKNKKTIHSKQWMDYSISNNDIFWVDLNNGGNDNFKLWKII